MLIVILFGLITIVTSLLFAREGKKSMLAFFQCMVKAMVYSILGGVTSNIAVVMWRISQNPEYGKSPDINLFILAGIAESLTPAILGFFILSLVYIIVAFGKFRFYGTG